MDVVFWSVGDVFDNWLGVFWYFEGIRVVFRVYGGVWVIFWWIRDIFDDLFDVCWYFEDIGGVYRIFWGVLSRVLGS